MSHLLCFGFGFCAQELARNLPDWRISAVVRHDVAGWPTINTFKYPESLPSEIWQDVSHIVCSVPPDDEGDLMVRAYASALAEAAGHVKWAGYLSTTGVYGDYAGDWVDEQSDLRPISARAKRRVLAEQDWQALYKTHQLPLHIFRLAGIYGPGRNQLVDVRSGKARRIIKPGQVFSRIHVSDVARILQASISRPNPGQIYNVCDDEAAPPQDVVAFAAQLLNQPAPPKVDIADADLSPMARSFYDECKRVNNTLLKTELGVKLRYPNYRAGLTALVDYDGVKT